MEDIITVIKGTELKILFTATIGDTDTSVDLNTEHFELKYYTDGETKLICTNRELEESVTDSSSSSNGDSLDTEEENIESEESVTDSPSNANRLKYKSGEEKNQILIRIPTKDLNPGILKCEATIYITDDDFSNEKEEGLEDPIESDSDMDGKRKEIKRENTKIKIIA